MLSVQRVDDSVVGIGSSSENLDEVDVRLERDAEKAWYYKIYIEINSIWLNMCPMTRSDINKKQKTDAKKRARVRFRFFNYCTLYCNTNLTVYS